jgi:hypothetical protein
MFAILHALGMFVVDLFKSRSRLEVENFFLRPQLNIALRRAPPRLRLHDSDRALLVWMTKLWPSLLGAQWWFSRRPSCDGIAPASKSFGVGNREIVRGGRGLIAAYVI